MRRPAAACLCAAALLAGLPARAEAAAVQVEIEGVEAGGGPVFVALCQGGLSGDACGQGDRGDGSGRFLFRDVAPGTYAVAAFQDTNRNGQLDRTGLGLPLEPYGFSGESGRRARPDFREAAFALREPGALIRVRLVRALPRR
ncbi:DUF2141 domain-containing protein [Methylobacterium sp. J-076]|uniref:DUF2141 domain-containing protein n=1 Tax=Methylobacterium sp. J-076 TaxID=2836655 RepID=UPI001FB8DB9A|nr:DUF2141 domain-containing protein [Methylobacterium sp. J-076]MCJ2011993.1 DUF2141 domain-containing protein [Methylobacterium sp. J-076]